MKLIRPSFEIMQIMGMDSNPLFLIESAGRTCYKSEDKMTADSSKAFVKRIMASGHHSVIEHSAMTVRFVIDRGVSHELVRHRLCAFSQESTRYCNYCNYKGGVTFIIPPWIKNLEPGDYTYQTVPAILDIASGSWAKHMAYCEQRYQLLLEHGWSPQQARSVLPNSLKTEIVVTANLREWIHIFRLRTSDAAHPQMWEIMRQLYLEVSKMLPEIFASDWPRT
jgi:thymidylate synthase (FAD)